jgi:hypothetical protein
MVLATIHGVLGAGWALLGALAVGLVTLGVERVRIGRHESSATRALEHSHRSDAVPGDPLPGTELSSTVLSLRYLHEGIRRATPPPGAGPPADIAEVGKIASDVEAAFGSLASTAWVREVAAPRTPAHSRA